VHDREVVATNDRPLPLFLLETRRGHDYHFATAAAILLRTLGFSTRVASGFYARPDQYDHRAQHTPVSKADAHFWCEVYLGGGVWATVEPTPGYERLGPPPGIWQRVRQALWEAVQLVIGHWLPLSVISGIGLLLSWQRITLLDALTTQWWRLRPARSPRQRVLQTFQLISQRLRWLGYSQRPGDTPSKWFQRLPLESAEAARTLDDLGQLADWAAFCPTPQAAPPPVSEQTTPAICARAVETITRSRVRRFMNESSQLAAK